MTIREAFKIRLDRLQAQRAELVAKAQEIQAQIDALIAARNALTVSDEATLANLQSLSMIQAQN